MQRVQPQRQAALTFVGVHTFVCKFTASFPAGQSPELLPGMPVELSLGGGYSFAEDFSLPASDEFQPSGPLMN